MLFCLRESMVREEGASLEGKQSEQCVQPAPFRPLYSSVFWEEKADCWRFVLASSAHPSKGSSQGLRRNLTSGTAVSHHSAYSPFGEIGRLYLLNQISHVPKVGIPRWTTWPLKYDRVYGSLGRVEFLCRAIYRVLSQCYHLDQIR